MTWILTAGINSSTGSLTEQHSCLQANYKHAIFTAHWPEHLLFQYAEAAQRLLNVLVFYYNAIRFWF